MALKKRSWIERNVAKLLFAGSIAVAVGFALLAVAAQAPSKAAVDDVKTVSAALKKRIEAKGKGDVPALPAVEEVVAGWREAHAPRADLPAWIFYREPRIVKTIIKPEDKRKELYPPVDLKAEARPDFTVSLAWKPNPKTTAEVKGYRIFRWKKGREKPDEPVSQRLTKTASFVDDDYASLAPLETYLYAVEVLTEVEVKSPGGQAVSSEPVEVSLPDDREVLFHGEGASVVMAVLYVKRFHRGDWAKERFSVKLGDAVGDKAMTEVNGEKVRLDFSTGRLLGGIDEEMKVEKEVERVPKRDEKGRPTYGEDGKPEFEEKVRERKVLKRYVILVDDQGEPEKIYETEKPKKKIGTGGPPPQTAPYFDRYLWELQDRLEKAKQQKVDFRLRRMLYERIKYLQRHRKDLVAPPGTVDENLLSEDGGLLYELRWKWLEAKDRALRFPNNDAHQREAERLGNIVKDLETFLTPSGWDREEKEWERDYSEFPRKHEGRDPARWTQMPPRPEKPNNTEGKN